MSNDRSMKEEYGQIGGSVLIFLSLLTIFWAFVLKTKLVDYLLILN